MQLKGDGLYLRPWQSIIAVMVALLLILAATGVPIYAQSGYVWQRTVVDSTGSVGRYASLALTSSGSPCISYFDSANDGALKYACQVGATWQSEIVDSGHVGWSTSLTMDAADYPHISYYNYSAGSVKYAYYDGTAWHTETVEGYGGRFGEFNDLALDAAGHPHIAYTKSGTNWQVLRYAYYDGSAWHKETVDGLGDADVGSYVSLALDADGHPHLSYQDDTNLDLRYAYYDGSTWHTETVEAEGNTGYHTSLALDAAGHPHISYTNNDYEVRYAYYDGSTWHTEMVERVWIVAAYPSLALDGDDHPHIAYGWNLCLYDCTGRLEYASYDGAAWQTETVDEGTDLKFTFLSLALDANNQPHIAYCEDENDDLRYVHGISRASLTHKIYLPLVLNGR